MYRIVFVPKLGKWVIKITSFFGLISSTVLGTDGKVMCFDTYTLVCAKVQELGLGEVYRNYHDSPMHQALNGAAYSESSNQHQDVYRFTNRNNRQHSGIPAMSQQLDVPNPNWAGPNGRHQANEIHGASFVTPRPQ